MTIAEIAPTTAQPVEFEEELPQLVASAAHADSVLLQLRALSPSLVQVGVGGTTLGFLELTGGIWVALCGPVYSWATEVGQSLDPDQAVLALFANGVRPAEPTRLPRGGLRLL